MLEEETVVIRWNGGYKAAATTIEACARKGNKEVQNKQLILRWM